MVDLPGDLAQPADSVLGTQAIGAGRRRAPGAFGGTCRCLLRQGIRRDLSRPRPHAGGRARARNRPVFAGGDVLLCCALPDRRHSARRLHRCVGARGAKPGGGSHAGAKRRRLALDRAGRRKPQLLQRPPGLPVHAAVGGARGLGNPPLGVRQGAPCPAVGLRVPRCEPGNPVHRIELRAADPSRVRRGRVSRPRTCPYARARRAGARATDGGHARPGLGFPLRARRRRRELCRRSAQSFAGPDDPTIPQPGLRRARAPAVGTCDMALILDLVVQGLQMLLVLLLAPLLTGFVRKVKARLLLRRGPPLIQPYRDLARLMRKEVVLAENASWLFRVSPYLIFGGTWVAASLVPTFKTGLLFSWSADLIAIVALLGSARFFLALAGLDVGTSFGGIGSSREVMIGSLAEPAMLMIVFTLALLAGSTQLSTMASYLITGEAGLRFSLGLALIALIIVAIAENARIPVDNPATHLELTMVHEAMVLEYSGRHLAMIELAAAVKLLLYVSLLACIFLPWGLASADAGLAAYAIGVAAYLGKLLVAGFLLAVFETSIAKMRVFRVPAFLGAALMLGLLGTLLLFVSGSL